MSKKMGLSPNQIKKGIVLGIAEYHGFHNNFHYGSKICCKQKSDLKKIKIKK